MPWLGTGSIPKIENPKIITLLLRIINPIYQNPQLYILFNKICITVQQEAIY